MRFVAGADDNSDTFDAAVDQLRSKGHDVEVLPKDDWPDIATTVAQRVVTGEADAGLLMCWTGTGTSMAANKVPGARAALCWDPWIAEGARTWNDANILVMSLKKVRPQEAREIVDAWLSVEAPDEDEAANIAKLDG